MMTAEIGSALAPVSVPIAAWLGGLTYAHLVVVGLVCILVAEVMLMSFAGVFNPTFTAYRMDHTPDALMARHGGLVGEQQDHATAVHGTRQFGGHRLQS